MKTIYEYACHECKVSWDREYPWGKPANKTKCPECGRRCGQDWTNRKAPAIRFKGAGWSQTTGFNREGGSDEINQKLQAETKERMKTGWQHYARYTPPTKLLDRARRLNDQEVANKLEASRKLSSHNYDKAGINPYKKIKPDLT